MWRHEKAVAGGAQGQAGESVGWRLLALVPASCLLQPLQEGESPAFPLWLLEGRASPVEPQHVHHAHLRQHHLRREQRVAGGGGGGMHAARLHHAQAALVAAGTGWQRAAGALAGARWEVGPRQSACFSPGIHCHACHPQWPRSMPRLEEVGALVGAGGHQQAAV